MQTISKPKSEETPVYFKYYISLCNETDLIAALMHNSIETIALLETIPSSKEDFKYSSEKWSVKEVLQHIIDSERIFIYRALRFSRKDATPLSGFDENAYAPNANTELRTLQHLMDEYKAVRNASMALYTYMNDEMLDFTALANGVSNNARAMGWMIVGHNIHHCNVLKERYLQ